MKVLALKRWRGGALNVKIRRKMIRRILRVWKEYALRIGKICKSAMTRRQFRRLRLAVAMEEERKRVEAGKVMEVLRRRKARVWREWQSCYLSDGFRRGEGEWHKVRRALGILKRRSGAFSERREEMDKWLSISEAKRGVGCVASVLWREGLRRFVLVRVGKGRGDNGGKRKWVGIIRRQSLYIAFSGLKVWLLGKLERAR